MMEERTLLVFYLSECFVLCSCLQREYHLVHESLTWSEAQTYCRQRYTDLATIQSSEEMNQVLETLSSAGYTSEVWIGLYSTIDWRWSDGFTGNGAEYRNWETFDYEPDFYAANQFCVNIDKNGTWWDDGCEISYSFICYNGTQLNPDFVLVTEASSWSGAQTYCRQHFTDLAVIRNDTEKQRVKSLVSSWSWIGLFRDPNFYWSDGGKFVYNNWEPVLNLISSNTAICGVTWQSSGKWKFSSCETRRSFVCHGRPAEVEIKRFVKLRLKTDGSVDLNNVVLRTSLLKKLKETLKMNGAKMKWQEQPDGEIFKKETTGKKT